MRELNARIRAIAAANGDGGDYAYTFVCECGCWSELRLTLADYDGAERVLRAGHGG